jgi:hypothetical protein
MSTPELAHIADIIPPTLVTSESGDPLYIIVPLIIIAAIGFYLYYRSSVSQVRHLRRAHRQRRINNRRIAFHLRRLLCQHLKLERFSPHSPPSNVTAVDWYRFAMRVEDSCFGRTDPEDQLLNEILDEAQNWMRKRS